MDIQEAAIVYTLKAKDRAMVVSVDHSKAYSPRMVILKNEYGNRLACVIESKKGYTIDLAKQMHGLIPPKLLKMPPLLRDARGRFMKRVQ
jgi:hypothetical protein